MIPDGIVTTAWPRVVAQCAEIGVEFDSWQHGIGSIALGKRKDGKYAATVGGVVLSIPRQVGKTFLVGMIIIALCILIPGLTVLWTAHRTRTATKTFQTMQGMVRRKKIRPHLADTRGQGIRTSNGEQEIRFRNNSVIMFGAREQGFGRGFDEVDVEVFDEGQILTERALEDMVPAANQSRQSTGALLFFMGTPPRPTDNGEEFTNRRTKALAGKAKNMAYIEFSADDDADPDDREQWSKANPSFPLRTPVESMERMREQLTDADSFRREALGIWDPPRPKGAAFPPGVWDDASTDTKIRFVGEPMVALDVRTGLKQSASVVVAGHTNQPFDVVRVARYEPDSGEQIVAEVVKILEERGLNRIAVDKYGENLFVIPLLIEAGLEVIQLDQTDMRAGATALVDAVLNGRLKHVSQNPLNAAVAGAGKSERDSGFTWSWIKSTTDIGPLRAATAAWWSLQQLDDADYDPLESIF